MKFIAIFAAFLIIFAAMVSALPHGPHRGGHGSPRQSKEGRPHCETTTASAVENTTQTTESSASI